MIDKKENLLYFFKAKAVAAFFYIKKSSYCLGLEKKV
jgi:hypothetical protein